MEEIVYTKSYKEYKAELDNRLNKAAESFVEIGYLLKIARDTDILAESPYQNVVEFAQAEYGIDKTRVSRFIHINDKFSEGGYSDRLQEKYRGFGWSKLTLMLELPDALNEELTPKFSRVEIQAIKDEVDEENKVTDIERMLEAEAPAAAKAESILDKAITQLGEDEPELYEQIHSAAEEEILGIVVPSEERIYSIRIRGTGRVMLSMSDSEDTVSVINSRTGEKETFSWNDVKESWLRIIDQTKTAAESWETVYGKTYPEKAKVAPVQQEKKKPKKKSKVVKAKPQASEKKAPAARASAEPAESQREEIAPAQKNAEILEREVTDEAKNEENNGAAEGETSESETGEETKETESCFEAINQPEQVEVEEVLPAEEQQDAQEVRDTEFAQTRKEYLDGCTEYGAALHLSRYLSTETLQNINILERWLKKSVDINGREIEEVEG